MSQPTNATSPADLSAVTTVLFDVNETLSDMAPIGDRFEELGLGRDLAPTWFAGVLRDGFALTVTGGNPSFVELAKGSLTVLLSPGRSEEEVTAGIEAVLGAFTGLDVHPDVVEGVRRLTESGHRLFTLSNGASSIAASLLERAGVAGEFADLLSVQDAPAWKPAAAAYEYAVSTVGVAKHEAVLVAVHPWDIDGAARAGLRTAWINRDGGLYPDYFRRADVEVPSLVGLAEALDARA